MPDTSIVKKILICASVWIVPTITGKLKMRNTLSCTNTTL
jgi:hypothetical protein